MHYQLVRPTIFYKKKYYEYLKHWGTEIIIPVISDLRGRRFETLLKELYEMEHDTSLPKGIFPDANYLFVDDNDDIIGFVNIRHHLSNILLNVRGNISYGLRPSDRNPETIEQLIKLSLKEAKLIGIKKLKFICPKTDHHLCNLIIDLNGIFESEGYNEVERYHIQRYWINLE